MESTYNLRADILRELLKHCTSVKTVRLCLQFGRELSLPWATNLNCAECRRAVTVHGFPDLVMGCWSSSHLDTVRLLVQVAPLVLVDNVFALKGGTAINLFVRDRKAGESVPCSLSDVPAPFCSAPARSSLTNRTPSAGSSQYK